MKEWAEAIVAALDRNTAALERIAHALEKSPTVALSQTSNSDRSARQLAIKMKPYLGEGSKRLLEKIVYVDVSKKNPPAEESLLLRALSGAGYPDGVQTEDQLKALIFGNEIIRFPRSAKHYVDSLRTTVTKIEEEQFGLA